MKYSALFVAFVLLISCEPERLKLNSNIRDLESITVNQGSEVNLTVSQNGEGIFILLNGEPVSNSASFAVDDRFGLGKQSMMIGTWRGEDSLMYPFHLLVTPSQAPASLRYEVVATYPHPQQFFTQGLVLDGDLVIESSGQYGESALSVYRLGTTDILQQHRLPNDWFAEGLAIAGDSLYQITWQDGRGMSYGWNGSEFTPGTEKQYTGREGWGLCEWNGELLWTDGSEILRYVDPVSYSVRSSIVAMNSEGLLGNLNELEMYKGYIAANLWQLNRIVFIHPENGICDKILDLDDIALPHRVEGTLNGIAAKGEHLLITGKNWPVMYELKIEWE